MSKKKKKKESAPGAQAALKGPSKKTAPQKKHRIYFLILSLFAFILYINTTQNGFAFDDSVVITANQYTKQGLKGIPDLVSKDLFAGIYGQSLELTGGRFRPLPLVTHAVEYSLWEDHHPGYDHLVNILLYAFAGVLLFLALERILGGKSLTAFITSLIFIAHPIHTEVVANIKSRDEILCFIFLMLTLNFLFRFIQESAKKYLAWSLICYLLSLFSKEHGITFIAVIPLVLFFFTDTRTKDIFRRTIPYLGIAVLYLFLRSLLLHSSDIKESTDIMENPFYGVSLPEKLATVSHILGKYFLLLLFPHPLSCDYSYNQIPVTGWGNTDAIIPFLIYLSLGMFALVTFRKKNIFSFCILFFFVTVSIVSNIFFNVGAPMGERFVFLPSLGFCLAAAAILMRVLKQDEEKNKFLPVKLSLPLLLVLVPASVKTITRNSCWKNNETLFAADIQTVPNSGKAHYYYGNVLYNDYTDSVSGVKITAERKKVLLSTAKHHTLVAIEIAPLFFHAHYNLGMIYMDEGKGDSAIRHLQKVTEIIPPKMTRKNGATLINASEKYISAMQNLARCWAMLKNNPDRGIEILKTALQYKPGDASTLEYMGICYAMKGDNTNALNYYNQSLQVNPDNAMIYLNIGKMYEYQGDKVKAQEYYSKSEQVKQGKKSSR